MRAWFSCNTLKTAGQAEIHFGKKKLLVEGNWSQLGRFHLFPVKDYSRWRRTLGNIDIVLSYITLLYKICYWDHFVNFSNHSFFPNLKTDVSKVCFVFCVVWRLTFKWRHDKSIFRWRVTFITSAYKQRFSRISDRFFLSDRVAFLLNSDNFTEKYGSK